MAFWKKKDSGTGNGNGNARKLSKSAEPIRPANKAEYTDAVKRMYESQQAARAEHLAKHPEDATAAEREKFGIPPVDGQPSQPDARQQQAETAFFEQPTPVTSGVLHLPDGEVIQLQSSAAGPAFADPTLGQPLPTRFHWMTHVEGHAAAVMRQRGLTEAQLTTNHPDGLCRACHVQAPAMMPPNAVMEVITPRGATQERRTQWLSQAGVSNHDPRLPAPPPQGDRIRLAPGGCWATGEQWLMSWDHVWQGLLTLVGRNPFFYDVSHESHAFEPFSLIGTADGTAMVSFEQSAGPFLMRSYGARIGDLETLGESAWRRTTVEWTKPEETAVSFRVPLISFLPPDHLNHTVQQWIDPSQRSTVFHEFPVF